MQPETAITGAIGGVRVQVMRSQLDEAKKALASYSPVGNETFEKNEEEIDPVVSDAFANRAFKTSIIGMLLWPFLYPYAVYLSFRALKNWKYLTTGERRKALFALIFSRFNAAQLRADSLNAQPC